VLQKLTASDSAADAEFGFSVSIAGDFAVVGAPFDDGSGSAYIFARNQGGIDNWGELRKVAASDGAVDDEFGCSVSVSGELAVVGARNDDNVAPSSGSAYVFSRNESGVDNWEELKKLVASDLTNIDLFGDAVSIAEGVAIIGAYRGTNDGSAYIVSERSTFGGPFPNEMFREVVSSWFSNQADVESVFGPIEGWDTGFVSDMNSIFSGRWLFNQNIGNWNTSSVTDMSKMFQGSFGSGTVSFNRYIGEWNTSSVVDMSHIKAQVSSTKTLESGTRGLSWI